jgi:hypothetical protein
VTGAVKKSRIAGASLQCRLVLPLADTSLNCGADALVCSRPPGRLFVSGKHLIPRANSGSRGTRADLGVCPTDSAPFAILAKLSGIGRCRLPSPLTGEVLASFSRS